MTRPSADLDMQAQAAIAELLLSRPATVAMWKVRRDDD
jgi:hypothetical protein